MTLLSVELERFLGAETEVALVQVVRARGSTPREEGAWMLVAPGRIFGTIGGGQLEFTAIDAGRELLQAPTTAPDTRPGFRTLDIPLGPEIGQCCGGRVELAIRPLDAQRREELMATAQAEDEAMPHVLIFGGGHVGQALAAACSLLPLQVIVVETRAEALESMPDGVETRHTAVPEQMVRSAPPGSAFVVLTHDHALDFLIVAEALGRGDAAYVGMIGSKTKKATFRNWYLKTAGGSEETLARLVSPIGGDAVHDKRPPVIAVLAAAEIMTAIAGYSL